MRKGLHFTSCWAADPFREAAALVQPLLIPRPAAVQDYIAGPASVFANDYARDKES